MTIASLSSGILTTNNSCMNCEDAVRIGQKMQKEHDEETPVRSMKISNKCKNLTVLGKRLKWEKRRCTLRRHSSSTD